MNNIISDYQKWKQQGEELRVQAKLAMEARYRDLLAQAIAIAEEYRADFGGVLKPPPNVTTFRYKTSAKGKTRKAKVVETAARSGNAPPKVPAKPQTAPSPKTALLEKKLAAVQQKFEAAKSSGAATKNLEDKIYEIEDAIRLSTSAG